MIAQKSQLICYWFRFWDLVVANKRPFALPLVALAAPISSEPPAVAVLPPAPSAPVAALAPAVALTEGLADSLGAGPLFANTRPPNERVD